MAKRAVLYARVSSDDRGKDGRNLEGQLEMCREHALEKGYSIVAEFAEDDRGARGASFDLEKLNQALEMARVGGFDVLVVRELDRFARSLAKQLVVESEFGRAGVSVEYVLAEYDETPEGQLQKHVRAVIAEYERLKIAERTTRARFNFVKRGNVLCHGRPPFGYRLAECDGKRTLEIQESEARVVKMIFDWYAAKQDQSGEMSLRGIALKLTELGIPTPDKCPHGKWNTSTITQILESETYAGLWYYGKYSNTDRSLSVQVPEIVSRELWKSAQEHRQENKRNSKRNTKYKYLMQRRLICGCCESKMSCAARKRKRGIDLYYYCLALYSVNYRRDCTQRKYFRADLVDTAVWEWIKSWLFDPEALGTALKVYQKEQGKENAPLRERMAVVEDLLIENRAQLERLLDLYLANAFPKEMLIERRKRLEATIAALEREWTGLAATLDARTLTDDQVQGIQEFTERIAQGLGCAEEDFEARRTLIEMLDVRATLTAGDEEIIIDVRCVLGQEVLSIASSSTGTG